LAMTAMHPRLKARVITFLIRQLPGETDSRTAGRATYPRVPFGQGRDDGTTADWTGYSNGRPFASGGAAQLARIISGYPGSRNQRYN
jgi:hypothetical protein